MSLLEKLTTELFQLFHLRFPTNRTSCSGCNQKRQNYYTLPKKQLNEEKGDYYSCLYGCIISQVSHIGINENSHMRKKP